MASYTIEWKRSALKELKGLPKDAVRRILVAVEALADNPLPVGARKLAGTQHTYRIHEGVHRIIYTVSEPAVTIEVLRVAHRKDAYD